MKIIQSYIPWRNPNKIVLDKDYIYSMMLSSLLLKRNYGSVTLYTNDTQLSFLKRFDFPYEYNTSILDNDTADVFAITKLKAMASQAENFIHFDLDSYVLDKPNLEKVKTPFLFSHNDIAFFTKNVKDITNLEEIIGSVHFNDIYQTYLKFYLNNLKFLGEEYPHKFIKLNEIPNMSLIYVRDVQKFKYAITKSLEVYEKIKKDIDSEWIGSAFIEQFTIPLYLKQISTEYKNNIDDSTLFKNSHIQLQDTNDNVKLVGSNYCSKCSYLHDMNESLDLSNPLDDLSKVSYYHAGGDKNKNIVKLLILKTLINKFGTETVQKIHTEFKKIYSSQNISNRLSESEKLYEQYMDSDIFTKLDKKSIF